MILKLKKGGLLYHWLEVYSVEGFKENKINDVCDLAVAVAWGVLLTLFLIVALTTLFYTLIFGVIGWIAITTGIFEITLMWDYFAIPVIITLCMLIGYSIFSFIPKACRKISNLVKESKYKDKICPKVVWEEPNDE